MSNYTFASMPSVSIARSKFHRTQPHNTSFNLGELVVLGIDECIPGSTHKVELGSLIRMSTPIAPIMDDIQMDVYSFLVPLRLTWEHWKQFMGESDQAGVSTQTFTIPQWYISGNPIAGSLINTTADDLGIPSPYLVAGSNYAHIKSINLLPFRAIALIYNRWFRNQNVEAPLVVSTGDTMSNSEWAYSGAGVAFDIGTGLQPGTNPGRLKAYKLPDYFTSSLPYAQKGDPVKIFGDNALAPVITGPDRSSSGGDALLLRKTNDGTFVGNAHLLGVQASNGRFTFDSANADSLNSTGLYPSNLWANLSASVNSTINDLRFAFQLQKALEKDALYGSRYWEVLRAHYAVTSPDATLQDPELLGHIKFDINISQVLQTTGFSSPSSTNLGTPGANSVTGNSSHLCTFSTVEHCYLIHIGVARQKRHTYSQGINRLWNRQTRWDFYHPVFANLGAQKVLNQEIYFDGEDSDSLNNKKTFAFQEAWAEYRFLPGYNSGLMNPVRPNALDYWTLAENFAARPTLGPTFLKEDRSNLARALVTGSNGPDFIGSFYFKDTVVNPMPLYSIPGFADHH